MNAAKISAALRPISVKVEAKIGRIEIEIMDEGPGNDRGDIPHIFDRFYQTCEPRGKFGGLALGLYIVRGFVEAHRGTVRMGSSLGKGTRFRFWFPRIDEEKGRSRNAA